MRSVAQNCGLPAGRRLPSMRTSVRDAPKLRKFTEEVPVAPLDRLLPKSAKADGNWLMMSEVLVIPSHLMSCAEITLTGLTLSSVGEGRREPVISTLSILCGVVAAVVVAAGAPAACARITGDGDVVVCDELGAGVASCALATGAARLTTMPAPSAFMTASDIFFRCILFMRIPPRNGSCGQENESDSRSRKRLHLTLRSNRGAMKMRRTYSAGSRLVAILRRLLMCAAQLFLRTSAADESMADNDAAMQQSVPTGSGNSGGRPFRNLERFRSGAWLCVGRTRRRRLRCASDLGDEDISSQDAAGRSPHDHVASERGLPIAGLGEKDQGSNRADDPEPPLFRAVGRLCALQQDRLAKPSRWARCQLPRC